MLWVKNAPKFGEQTDEEVCDFIDKYVSCSVPKEDGLLKEFVLSLQKHRHSVIVLRNAVFPFHIHLVRIHLYQNHKQILNLANLSKKDVIDRAS